MSAWSRSLYLDLAQQLACGSIAVNEAAGGAAAFKSVTDYAGALATIACQLNAANNAQGATAVGLDFSSIPGLTQTIACLTGSLAGTNVPYGSYDMYAQWNAIACNLNTIAVNTGGASPGGLQGGSIYAFMNAAICSMNQIAENGFAPPDPVQEFINALNAFNPDALFIADTISSSPVTSWEDSSGNGHTATPPSGNPTVSPLTPNGKQSVRFNGSSQMLFVPLANTGSTSSTIAVFNSIEASQTSVGRIVTAGPASGVDYDATGFTHGYFNGPDSVTTYHNPTGAVTQIAAITGGVFQIFSSVADGANARLRIAAATNSGAYAGTPFAITKYGIGGWVDSTAWYAGDIPFVFIKKAALSAPDEASVISLVNAYYGL